MFSDSRGLVDGLVGNVGVEFLGEVIVFALHLCAEVVNAVVDIRIHFAEPGIYIGVQVAYPLVKITNSIVHIADSIVHIADSIVHIADSIVHIADSIVHITDSIVHIADSIVHIADSIVHITDSIVHITDSIVHIAESLALNGYHVIKNGRESHGEANNERYELRVCHGALLLSTMLPQLYAAFGVLSSGKSV